MPPDEAERESMVLYVATYTPGPNWREPEAERPADIEAHVAHQHLLYDEGRLVMGGPFTDRPGGMALLMAERLEDVLAIIEADPAVISGSYVVDVTPWRVALGAPGR